MRILFRSMYIFMAEECFKHLKKNFNKSKNRGIFQFLIFCVRAHCKLNQLLSIGKVTKKYAFSAITITH